MTDLIARLRADPRVPLVERGLLAARLGETLHDLESLGDAVVSELLAQPSARLHTVGAHRLLERLDAQVARAHPVDLERRDGVVAAIVHLDGDDGDDATVVTGTLRVDRDDPEVVVEVDDVEAVALTLAAAEALAHALLRLVELGRTEPPTEE